MSKLANPASHALFRDMCLQKGPSKCLIGESLASAKEHFCRVTDLPKENIVHVSDSNWIIFNGTKYICSECTLIVRAENEKLVFGDLLRIWIADDSDVLFRIVELETIGFNHTLNFYKVEKLGQAQAALMIATHNLLTYEVVHKWEVGHRNFINTKYGLSDLLDL